ncbi:unnamed protein product [Taenia asiatica]|uniref:Transposase n=1 Tax=Taenia asiatica TaxID=60517 RepID=A0A0R3WFQ7_TAEAS|nr:unnamed protein product [Taenia asiatica]
MMQSCFKQFCMLIPEKQRRSSPDQVFFALVLLIETRRQGYQFMYRYALFPLHPFTPQHSDASALAPNQIKRASVVAKSLSYFQVLTRKANFAYLA